MIVPYEELTPISIHFLHDILCGSLINTVGRWVINHTSYSSKEDNIDVHPSEKNKMITIVQNNESNLKSVSIRSFLYHMISEIYKDKHETNQFHGRAHNDTLKVCFDLLKVMYNKEYDGKINDVNNIGDKL